MWPGWVNRVALVTPVADVSAPMWLEWVYRVVLVTLVTDGMCIGCFCLQPNLGKEGFTD